MQIKTFNNWLAAADQLLLDQIGLSLHDLEDFHWDLMYEDDHTPAEAIQDFLEEFPEYDI